MGSFWAKKQGARRHRQFVSDEAATELVDLHCHCLPGLDDGPATESEALELCHALVADGIKTVVATPHQLGFFEQCADSRQIRRSVALLNETLRAKSLDLEVLSGAEIRVDPRVPQLLRQDTLMTLADRQRFCLLELPFDTLPDIRAVLDELSQLGIRSVIAHPERNSSIAEDPDLVMQWTEYELTFQISATSVLGDSGRRVKKAAWKLLDMPIRCIMATDAHGAVRRPPLLGPAYAAVADRLGPNRARELCVQEPLRILGRSQTGEETQNGNEK